MCGSRQPPSPPSLGTCARAEFFSPAREARGPRVVRTRVWGRPWPYGATLWPGGRIRAGGRMAWRSTHVSYSRCSFAEPLVHTAFPTTTASTP